MTAELLDDTLRLADKHSIRHIIAHALQEQGLVTDEPLLSLCQHYVLLAASKDVRRSYELERVGALFEKNGIMYLPLKGAVIRALYPESWMRNSCDIDILVQKSDLEKVVRLLTDRLNYAVEERGVHDVSLSIGDVRIELHFDLIEEGRAKHATDVLKGIWSLAMCKAGGSEHYLPDEVFYFYHIAHMAKHMTGGGCGIRNFIDVWLLNHVAPYDAQKRQRLLTEGGLQTFASVTQHLAEVWFGGATHTALTKEMEAYVINSGTYGNVDNRIALTKINFGSKCLYYLPRLFMPYRLMKLLFPILERYPILLPFFWIKRICMAVFSKPHRQRIKAEIQYVSQYDNSLTDRTEHLMKVLEL